MIHLFLDIGFTLVGGPPLSPSRKIAEILGLDPSVLPVVADTVFGEEHYGVESLLESLSRKTGRAVNRGEREAVRELWNRQFTDAYILEGAEELMARLCASPYGLHIVSNIWHPFFHAFRTLFAANLDRVGSVTVSYREGVRKPSPEIFRRALAKAGAGPARTLMIGDSLENDILPCRALGMKCVWYRSRPGLEGEDDRLLNSGPVRTVAALADVPAALEELIRHDRS